MVRKRHRTCERQSQRFDGDAIIGRFAWNACIELLNRGLEPIGENQAEGIARAPGSEMRNAPSLRAVPAARTLEEHRLRSRSQSIIVSSFKDDSADQVFEHRTPQGFFVSAIRISEKRAASNKEDQLAVKLRSS